ncbi:MAG: 6-hydroxycyclohex-1-ene-1-carbonyl-CoA dehydrogenase [Candidatus Kapabacteria bacterium]|nr:6-hydroxycyclohex-1-ene-1-carbonyl-CoA dehydrogenase [Candidatus Kapabacteria bacterium]
MNQKMYSWKMTELKSNFQLIESELPEINESEVIVEVAGCGVCHTDLSFWYFGVPTKQPLPLTLGHEISGTIVKGPASLLGNKVIIPAVLPCGECVLCKNGRSNICQKQLMPGNDFDGGFASHIKVPYRYLCPVDEKVLEKYELSQLAVIADAVSTPYQVIEKSGLGAGDFAIVIGVGGVGIYAALIAKIRGAKVLALDIDDAKLAIATENGIDAVLNIRDLGIKEIKGKIKEITKSLGVPPYMWKIFEMSGTKAGQELGFALIGIASTLSVVGFTLDKLELRLSNLMAFDATLIGTWGCKPELYPSVLALVSEGKLPIEKFIETFKMSEINEVFHNTLTHKYSKRSIMIPDFGS